MWSILYTLTGDTTIHRLGPFASDELSMAAARDAQKRGEFDVKFDDVYQMSPDHTMIELAIRDLKGKS